MDCELVIVSYRRMGRLAATLAAVRKAYPDLAICIGLQGAEGQGAAARALAARFGLRLEALPEPSITRTLNHCIQSSTADLVLLLDDDALPCPGWLEAHVAAFAADPALAYSCGREIRMAGSRGSASELLRILVEWAHRPFLRRDALLDGRVGGWMLAHGVLLANLDRAGSCVINAPRGCNMALDRRQFAAAGAFCEEFRGNGWGFEPEFGVRLARAGQYGRYLGAAAVLHAEQPGGGSRALAGSRYLQDFWHNHRVLMRTLGPLGWLGALPRLAAKPVRMRRRPAAPAYDEGSSPTAASS